MLPQVVEGDEPANFWSSIGGEGEYPKTRPGDLGDGVKEPRLFQLSNSSGALDVDEVCNFSQEDLVDDDVMLLDTYATVYVWLGSNANEQEKRYVAEGYPALRL